jgi:CubicO group peptidase (beta-lactamase class C family)
MAKAFDRRESSLMIPRHFAILHSKLRHLAGPSLLVAAIAIATLASAQETASAPAAATAAEARDATPATHRPLEREDVEAWLDGYMPFALQRGDVAGAVVVVVKGGKILAKRGYGYSDVATHRPVDPDITLFRAGSVSKLMTWTAVMQQIEAGHLNIDHDVNEYLDFKIPPFDGRPITMRNLMTHTAGFEDAFDNLIVMDPKVAPSVEEFVKHHIPARVYEPGKIPAYSNYGAALAGYIVQRVSGVAFADYMDRRIFAPLGMGRSSFHQPLPERFRTDLSNGYERASRQAQPYEIAIEPAGNAAVTAVDMAHFMIAHLQDGQYEQQRIMNADTARLMHSPQASLINPAVGRMALGFFAWERDGRRILGHEGDTFMFHSALQLYPDENVGIFLSTNSVGLDGGARALREGLMEGFADRYFGEAPASVLTGHFVPKDDLALVAGSYDSSSRPCETFLSILALGLQTRVEGDSEGHLIASSILGLNGEPKHFEEIAPFVWREIGGKTVLAAKVENGRVTAWGEGTQSPAFVYLPTPSWRNATWLLPALAISMAVLLLTALAWPIDACIRRCKGAPPLAAAGLSWRITRLSASSAAGVMIAWMVLIGFMFAAFDINSRVEPVVSVLHALSVVVFPLGLLASIWNVHGSLRPGSHHGIRSRIWSVLLAASFSVTLWAATVFHLIGTMSSF